MTTVLVGTASAGRISATTCLASSFEQWTNFAGTAARFSSVITLASWGTFEMQSRPCAKCGAGSALPAALRPRHRPSPETPSTDYE